MSHPVRPHFPARRITPAVPMRLLALASLALLLCACSGLRESVRDTPSPAVPPAPAVPPPNPPRVAPVPSSGPTTLDPANEARERDVRRAELARGPRALPAGDAGYYLDVLHARLRQNLGSDAVSREGDALRVRLPASVSFEIASARLSVAAEQALTPLLAPLADYTSLLITVHGHTDASGPADVNRRLSAQRAQTVARRLQALGLPQRQLLAVGHGADVPVADNDSPESRGRNRRVELLLEPIVAAAP